MARGKFQTLTEQMFYILLCLRQERCGADVMAWVAEATGSRVAVGPGTLYNCWSSFCRLGTSGRRRWRAGSGAMCSPPLGGKPWRQRPGGCGS